MTNDTNTLNGALQELGETMADNLQTMGVTDASASDGLTTLANRILDIQSGMEFTLTGDKTVLSAYDNETLTLTASFFSGFTVELYDNTDTLIDEMTDNEDGTYSYTYSATGAGDVGFYAKVGTLVSETYSLEDCLFYDPCTSNAKASAWTIPSGVTSQYSSDGWRISANAYKQIKLTDKITSDCSVEFTVTDKGHSGNNSPVIIYAYTNGETTPNQGIITETYKTSSFNALNTTISHAFKLDTSYRIEYTSSTLEVYEDDTLIATASNSVGLPTRFEIHQGANSRYAVYKDIKVKPL